MYRNKLVRLQFAVILFNLFSFWIIGNIFGKLESFVISITLYWCFMIGGLINVNGRGGQLGLAFKQIFQSSKKSFIMFLAYIPALGVFFAAFLPALPEFKLQFFLIAAVVGLLNGFIEEIFWRGILLDPLRTFSTGIVVISTILFALNHGAFLLLDFSYQGGALSLMGGPLVMGILWITVAQKTGTLKHGIIAHQMVNCFAFTSLFLDNLA